MSELQIIQTALQGASRRRRWARGLRGLWWGLLIGATFSLLLIGLYHVLPLPLWTLTAAALIPLPCMLIGLVLGGWRTLTLKQVACWVDGRQHLQERLSTALEVASIPEAGTWRDLVLSDAAGHAKAIEPGRLVPFRLPARVITWAVVLLAMAAGLGFVPEYRSKAHLRKKADEANIKQIGKQLAELTRHELKKRPPVLEPTQKALEKVTDLGDQLSKKTLTRSEALKDLANVAQKLKDELKDMAKDPGLKRLEQAARNGGNDGQTASGLQKQMDSLQKQVGRPTGNPDALEKLKKDLAKLEEAAKGLADKNSSGSDAERQKVSESLSALSKQAQEMGAQLPQLDEAIAAMAANQTDMVLKDLQAAMTDLEKMRDMAKALQQLQQQMEKMGKDLAEQLQNGQPEAAQQTLQKMVSQLNSANLSPEEMKKMLEEVSKAVAPAGNYGKVAEHLKEAGKQLQAGDKVNASQALASAAKELQKLMEQMGDAQELAAALENLNQASMCIGSCQGWRQCNSNRPGFSNGGKPGGGVGTWANDEAAEWNGQINDRWDNTGAVRPDTDPRGHTDRGDGNLSDALKPTKVKGQFSPGGQMPSITLKGVSIRGQSKVQYEEAAAAAQSDAQSALSQEKVPRAYQGAVKDYFDDLKSGKK